MTIDQSAANDTQNRLIHSAMTIFARHGYEGTTTRELAKAADVALSAINYHFGGKPELYNAVAEKAVQIMHAPLAGVLADTAARIEHGLTPSQAVAALETLVRAVTEAMLAAGRESEAASKFAMRELMIAGPALGIIYSRIVEPIIGAAARLLAVATGRPPGDARTLLEATTLFGPITLFRMLYNHRLGATTADDTQEMRNMVHEVIRKNIRALTG